MILKNNLTWHQANHLKIGDELIGFDEFQDEGTKTRNYKKSVILSHEIIEKPCYRIYLKNGETLVSSEDHLWLIDVGNNLHGKGKLKWVKTSELRGENKTKSLRLAPHKIVKLFDVNVTYDSYELGYLAGIFDGEGYLQTTERKDHKGYNLRLGFAQRKNEAFYFALSILDKIGVKYKVHAIGTGTNKDVFSVNIIGKRKEVIKFLSIVRPKRLLAKFDSDRLGYLEKIDSIEIENIEFIGLEKVVAMETSTKTFIADGYASHNCAPTGLHDDAVCALALANRKWKAGGTGQYSLI